MSIVFFSAIEPMLNNSISEYQHVHIIGYLNVNFKIEPNSLSQTCDKYDLKQTVKGPTCFKSLEKRTLLDLILTNSSNTIQQTVNVPLGISDFHNYISAATRILCPSSESELF